MGKQYTVYPTLNLPEVSSEVLEYWEKQGVFEESIRSREGQPFFVFYEGPPSANGLPGIHHVISRTIKDLFCRYKTMQGFQVNRRAGWDTHGLPVELSVEKELGITKEDIGQTISIPAYNQKCRENVMKYTDVWNDLTHKMGYWVDMDQPYVTYETKYIESVWHLLSRLHKNNMLYKGYTIQPYSPKAGTGLSSHELNQPGTYKNVKDTTVVAQFRVNSNNEVFGDTSHGDCFFLAWTTTPWTLPSNTALAVGPKIEYVVVNTYNQYTHQPITVVLAKNLLNVQFNGKYKACESDEELKSYTENNKSIPYRLVKKLKGADLIGIVYEQLLPFALPYENADEAFRVIAGDFVTTEDGTGIVHIAPTFGADDAAVAKLAGVPPLLILDELQNPVPLVDLQGKFVNAVGPYAGKYVKNEYYTETAAPEKSVDVEIAIQLKEENKAFKVEKYEHSYPHCWRTDKPVLYYPLDSWFVKTTAAKDRLIELNKEINWKPASTGTGRFGNWLENLQDWNLSRSRYWGIPIPIWSTEDGSEQRCIGSLEELKSECDKAVAAGVMKENPLAKFTPNDFSKENYNLVDLHRPYVDDIVLVSNKGEIMKRESDLIDVWFDSGSMPYAQWHYPFENKALFEKSFPADFIAEGVDQTRGWFFTLHAIATMCFDQVAYKNVVSNGLVLDKNGQKMSKRLGNAADPFETLAKYGADATRWYMISNAQPWDNLKFDEEGITEVQRKFFGTLYNSYGFFALYANVDGFDGTAEEIQFDERPEIDRWVLSKLHSLIQEVTTHYEQYEPTRAARAIGNFVTEQLSNWYVRLSRRRFWKGTYTADKISAYQTLYECLEKVAQLSAPIAPFYMDRLFNDLNKVSGKHTVASVHLSSFPTPTTPYIDGDLESRMDIAQRISSLILGLRKKEKIKVRQPLQKIMIPVAGEHFKQQLMAVKDLILSEVNVKELEFLAEDSGVFVKRIKPNFKSIGPRYGKQMKDIAATIATMGQKEISEFEQNQELHFSLNNEKISLNLTDVEIFSDDIPGFLVAIDGNITAALDVTLNEELVEEGLARELVNRIQNFRKESGLEVTDKIKLKVKQHIAIDSAVENNKHYICAETLAEQLELVENIEDSASFPIELDQGITTAVAIEKLMN
jgi:isoleucyl-tRNA synthetase